MMTSTEDVGESQARSHASAIDHASQPLSKVEDSEEEFEGNGTTEDERPLLVLPNKVRLYMGLTIYAQVAPQLDIQLEVIEFSCHNTVMITVSVIFFLCSSQKMFPPKQTVVLDAPI